MAIFLSFTETSGLTGSHRAWLSCTRSGPAIVAGQCVVEKALFVLTILWPSNDVLQKRFGQWRTSAWSKWSTSGFRQWLSLLDLSAAFDTIDHNIPITRLRSTFGCSGMVLDWLSPIYPVCVCWSWISPTCSAMCVCVCVCLCVCVCECVCVHVCVSVCVCMWDH